MAIKYRKFSCNQSLNHVKEIELAKILSDIVMFDGSSNVQLASRLLKVHYPKLTVMRGVEHKVWSFSNDYSNITIVNQIIIPKR